MLRRADLGRHRCAAGRRARRGRGSADRIRRRPVAFRLDRATATARRPCRARSAARRSTRSARRIHAARRSPLLMRRIRAALPLLLLIGIGAALWATGALDRFRPQELVAQQQQWHQAVIAHPLLAWCIYVGLVALVIATGVPGSWVVSLAGGMLFGIARAPVLTGLGELIG